MNWNVTLDFKRGPSFGAIPVVAATAEQAIAQAKAEAVEYGFDQPVKKALAVLVAESAGAV